MNEEPRGNAGSSIEPADRLATNDPSAGQPAVDRAAALKAGRTPISPKFIIWAIVAFAVLGLGGEALQHFDGNLGLPTTATIPITSTTTTIPANAPTALPMSQFIGLRDIGTARAPGFTLKDQTGHKWSLTSAKGKVVVLAFYDANCNDICPVLGAEIREARSLLGSNASKVDFIIVNANPNDLEVSPSPPALQVPDLLNTSGVDFLTGSLSKMNDVWSHYGISIRVGAHPGDETHNDLAYFIDPTGRLRAQIDPFATENAFGVASLNAKELHRFALGISRVADSLIK
jgi:protein SCO1/2